MAWAGLTVLVLLLLAILYRLYRANRQEGLRRHGLEDALLASQAVIRRQEREIGQQRRDLNRQTEDVQQRDRQWQTLAEGLPDGVARFDVAGRFVFANGHMATGLGVEPASLLGNRPGEVPGLADGDVLDDELGRAVRLGESGMWVRQVGEGPSPTWHQWIVLPELDGDGRVVFVQVVIRDISDRMAAEAALAETRELAECRGTILGRLGHDLRTPLNGILGHVQLLARDRLLAERQSESLKVIRDSGDRLLALLEDILQRARTRLKPDLPTSNGPVVEQVPPPVAPVGWPAPPPVTELESLHHLAQLGNMRTLIAESLRIEAMDPDYHDFASHLRSLAEAYESQAIVAFVKHYLDDRRI